MTARRGTVPIMGSSGGVRLVWADGSSLRGATLDAVLADLGKRQWEPCSAQKMRHRLSDRAWNWNGSLVDPFASDDEFMAQLDSSGIVSVVRLPNRAGPEKKSG